MFLIEGDPTGQDTAFPGRTHHLGELPETGYWFVLECSGAQIFFRETYKFASIWPHFDALFHRRGMVLFLREKNSAWLTLYSSHLWLSLFAWDLSWLLDIQALMLTTTWCVSGLLFRELGLLTGRRGRATTFLVTSKAWTPPKLNQFENFFA